MLHSPQHAAAPHTIITYSRYVSKNPAVFPGTTTADALGTQTTIFAVARFLVVVRDTQTADADRQTSIQEGRQRDVWLSDFMFGHLSFIERALHLQNCELSVRP